MIKNLSDSFFCWHCEKNLIDNRYIIKNTFAICLSCYEEKYSSQCYKCKQIIGVENQGCEFQNKTWHNSCFTCSICKQSLIDKKYSWKNNDLFCRYCFINIYGERCYRCNRSLEPGEQCLEYDRQIYHISCFLCNFCQQKLINMDFRSRDQYFLCIPCYTRIVGIYCIKCRKTIENNGIIYHNHPFHFNCFLCTNCSKPLENQRYVEYNNEAYCSSCSVKLFKSNKTIRPIDFT